MKNPKNKFKKNLKLGVQQIGIWNTIGGNTVPEALANCGFDWVLVDTEHAAVETVEVISALQAIAGYPDVSAVVRPAANDPVLIKRILDMGALTLLLPYVQTQEEAIAAVRSVSYGPEGVRGIAGVPELHAMVVLKIIFNMLEKKFVYLFKLKLFRLFKN